MPVPKIPATRGLTISELISAWAKADPRGPDDREVVGIARACVPLYRMFGDTPADEFTAPRLVAVQEALIAASWMTPEERAGEERPWSRQYCNKQIGRMKRIFRWGEAHGYCPAGAWQHLCAVPPIKADRRTRNTPPRAALDWDTQVDPVLGVVSRQVGSLIRLQFLAGMRPQDCVKMRPCDLDPDGPDGCWLYRPDGHKGTWREHDLVKVLGPAALAILRPWIDMAKTDTEYLFPPHKRNHGQHISVGGYSRAVAAAVKATGVRPWSPADLRHAGAAFARRVAGEQGVKAFLGHQHAQTAKHYGKAIDLETAAEVARKIGAV